MNRLRRLPGQMGLSPVNCRKVVMACAQSVAMFGAELRWKATRLRVPSGGPTNIQRLVNQEARAITGCF